MERWWETDNVGWYRASVLVRVFNGGSSSLWFDNGSLSICNNKKRDVEPTTDDNDEPLTISIGLAGYKKKRNEY